MLWFYCLPGRFITGLIRSAPASGTTAQRKGRILEQILLSTLAWGVVCAALVLTFTHAQTPEGHAPASTPSTFPEHGTTANSPAPMPPLLQDRAVLDAIHDAFKKGEPIRWESNNQAGYTVPSIAAPNGCKQIRYSVDGMPADTYPPATVCP
jgi:hypothetical protein